MGETVGLVDDTISDIHISSFKPLITPDEIRKEIPISDVAAQTVAASREQIAQIITRNDKRIFLIVGPCSIHDPRSAFEYAEHIKALAEKVADTFVLVMRTYFEKPRTTVGWKGFINDPRLDSTFNMNAGLREARKLLLRITQEKVPVATECLEPISPQYISELISWTAIGARTTESQTHREIASGLSSPVGFKNNTDGNIEVAINAIKSAQRPHHFLGIDKQGRTSIVSTKGNPSCHLILRGGKAEPNYNDAFVRNAISELKNADLCSSLVIDCSHDNSVKDYRNQPKVFTECIQQIVAGNNGICGLMLESHLSEGRQPVSENLRYGVSITDGCIDVETTKRLILDAREMLARSVEKNRRDE